MTRKFLLTLALLVLIPSLATAQRTRGGGSSGGDAGAPGEIGRAHV